MILIQLNSWAVWAERGQKLRCLPEKRLISATAKLFELKESGSHAVYAWVCQIQYYSWAVWTADLFGLRWVNYSVPAKLFSLKEASAKLFVLRRAYYSILAELFSLEKVPAELFGPRWAYYSVLAEPYSLKECTSWAVCAEMILLLRTSRPGFTEGKPQPSCLR
jgi:phosphopantetheinyl transferase (holo-ACP synthase)